MGKAEIIPTRNGQIDEKLLKPFTLGWTREVVKRKLAKSPKACDIYYFSPDGKKLRSLKEVKGKLSDGLNPDCFSFKREIFGVDTNFETVRDANYKRRISQNRLTEPGQGPSGAQAKSKKTGVQNQHSSSENAIKDAEDIKEAAENNAQKKRTQKAHNKNVTTKRKRRNVLAKVPLPQIKREIFRKVVSKQKKQGQVLARKKLLRKVATTKNEETENAKKDEGELKIKGEAVLKRSEKEGPGESVIKNSEIFLRSREKLGAGADCETTEKRAEADLSNDLLVLSTKTQAGNEEGKEAEESTDLKSIVQKNIGKYRKLREKQKMKLISAQLRKSSGRIINNSRAESFLLNRSNYLKPLQKGWRRELVYRSNSSKAGRQADVYYFHPNGKKFRSSREIMDNPEMISGLSIDFFTFRKEAVGCGEPLEVIRSAHTTHKH